MKMKLKNKVGIAALGWLVVAFGAAAATDLLSSSYTSEDAPGEIILTDAERLELALKREQAVAHAQERIALRLELLDAMQERTDAQTSDESVR